MFYSDDEEVDAVARVIKSKKLFRYQGEGVDTECTHFEKEFSNYLNKKKSILVSNGTNAIVLALKILGISPGDEVLVPSYTFFATVLAVLDIGAIPILVPIDKSLSFDFTQIEKFISARTKAIIPVHMDGFPCNMKAVLEVSKKHNLLIIEDSAQGLGAKFEGKKVGTFGNVGCFSFNVDKIISCGEGGAIVIDDEVMYQKAMMFHDVCNQFGPTMRNQYTIDSSLGKNMRVSEIQGAMIRVQLTRLEKIVSELHLRKDALEERLLLKGYQRVHSLSLDGESGTTVRILANNPLHAMELMRQFNGLGFHSIILANKNGNNLFKWKHFLKQPSSDFLSTLELISTTIAINISLEDTIESWCNKVNLIN
jgi:8-amino-3,8-dideoxy-alpha-D-manno-octulosonate transaminase